MSLGEVEEMDSSYFLDVHQQHHTFLYIYFACSLIDSFLYFKYMIAIIPIKCFDMAHLYGLNNENVQLIKIKNTGIVFLQTVSGNILIILHLQFILFYML